MSEHNNEHLRTEANEKWTPVCTFNTRSRLLISFFFCLFFFIFADFVLNPRVFVWFFFLQPVKFGSGQTGSTFNTFWLLHRKKQLFFLLRMLKLQKVISVSSNTADEQLLLLQVSVKLYEFTGEIKMKPLPLGLWVTLKLVFTFVLLSSFQVSSFFSPFLAAKVTP